MNSDKALELARLAYPNDENLRVAYMLGVDKGYEFCREDMLKDAVEGEIEEVSFNNGEVHNTIRFSFDEESLRVENRIWFPHSGKDGDKVRIVVLKEEEE